MNQFVVAEGSSASLSPAQQARVEMFADGMDRESAGGVEWKDLQHWQMGTELVSARELPAESFILVPNESPAEEGRIDFPFLSRTCLWVLKVTNVTVVSNVRAQLFVVGSLFEGCIDPIFAAGAQYSAALPLQSVVLMLIPGFAIFKSVADVFAARHSPQQHAVIPDPEDDGSRKRKACDPVVESSEDGEESAGEDGALPSRRLVTSGKRFHDLDGVERVCQLKLKMDVVYEFQVLFRVLKEERIDALLEVYRFSVDCWRSLAVMHLSCPPTWVSVGFVFVYSWDHEFAGVVG
jgi:hypothetical protein